LGNTGLKITDGAVRVMVRSYTYEAGVRNLEREIGSLCRKATRRLAEDKRPLTVVTGKTVEKYLGPPRFLSDNLEKQDEVGVAMGLAWTPNGGDLLPVEVALIPGKGNLILTGQLGDVMQESAQAALTYLRSKAETLGIQPEVFEKTDIHIHLPEGGIPKDGPSGGITMAVALCSAFTGRPVRRDVAMTGEITLRGRILPVGGLKEKLLTAHRADVKKVLLPARNAKDLQEIPRNILKKLNWILVESMETVLEETLQPLPENPPHVEVAPVVSDGAA
jgi:ATP-dependent Lon protease